MPSGLADFAEAQACKKATRGDFVDRKGAPFKRRGIANYRLSAQAIVAGAKPVGKIHEQNAALERNPITLDRILRR